MDNLINKRIHKIFMLFAFLFLALIINLTYLQFYASGDLSEKPNNARPLLYQKHIKRGSIISSDGKLLAQSIKTYNGYERIYPYKTLVSHITGYYSTKYGRAGLELTYDEELSGQSRISSLSDYTKHLLGEDSIGNDLVLTIDMKLQELAYQKLGVNKGAIVVLDAKTGATLVLASNPSFDPNHIEDNWKKLNNNPNSVMLNRATQGKFTPGSSFKIVTSAIALKEKVVRVDSIIDAPPSIKIYGGKVTNFEGKGHGKMRFDDAFAKSVNTVFAQIGTKLGSDRLQEGASAFGLLDKIPYDLPTAAGFMPNPNDVDDLESAWLAVGQGRLLVTPIHMALVVQSIANNGKIMRPYLVKYIKNKNGQVIYQSNPQVWLKPIPEQIAEDIKQMMIKVVEEGTARRAKINGIVIAGKTGTAEISNNKPHAWFVGFAPADNPQIVTAVIIENGGIGGKVAAPIAKDIIEAALNNTN